MMVTHVSTRDGTLAELGEWIERSRTQLKRGVRKRNGLKAAYWLLDREAGRGMIFTLWETEEGAGPPMGGKATCAQFEVVDALYVYHTFP